MRIHFILAGCLIALCLVGCGRNPEGLQYDCNHDGKSDRWEYATNNLLSCVLVDRNHDGKPDYYEWYTDGFIDASECEDAFDGRVTTICHFFEGQVTSQICDFDGNGIPDSVTQYSNGVPTVSVMLPDMIFLQCYTEYRNGAPYRMIEDADGDGFADTEEMLLPLSRNIVRRPLIEKLAMKSLYKLNSPVPTMRRHGPP